MRPTSGKAATGGMIAHPRNRRSRWCGLGGRRRSVCSAVPRRSAVEPAQSRCAASLYQLFAVWRVRVDTVGLLNTIVMETVYAICQCLRCKVAGFIHGTAWDV